MKVARIALKNFRAYENAEIVFDEPLSIIRGANHMGKSSIAQALQLALSKRTDGTDARGTGAQDKIRQGQKKAEIDVTLETLRGPIECLVGYTASGRTQKLSVEAFASNLIENASAWAAVLDPEFFVNQKVEDQKAILASLVLPHDAELDPAMLELMHKYGTVQTVEDESVIDRIDGLYGFCYDMRRGAKDVLEHIQIPTKPAAPDYTVEQIEEYLGKLRDQIEQLPTALPAPAPVQDNGREIGRLESELTQKQRELTVAQENLQSAKDRIADCDRQMLSGPQITKHKRIADERSTFESLTAQIAEIDRQIAGKRQDEKLYRGLLATPTCPTCTQVVEVGFIEKKLHEATGSIGTMEEKKLDIQRGQKDLGDINGAETKLADHERAKQSKLDWVTRQTANSEALTRIGKEIVALNDKLNELRAAPSPTPAPAVDQQAIETARALTTKIQEWTGKLTDAKRYATVCEHIERETERLATQKEKVADLERLCTYFGKDGVKAQLIQKHLSDFEDSINGVLSAWEYSAELSIEPYQFKVTTADGKTLPLKELSGSERLMFGVALQAAISVHAKIRLMVIDRADTFINGERGNLFTGLQDLLESGTLDQVIVLVADDRTEVPNQPGVAFYRTAQGKVERLGQHSQEEAA